ncbi:MAG: hypothetical protein LUQ64_00825, partial [Methanomicrobiales archaeon]|nr:hypothetical protein [Methanomicrobiales archaeon]
MRRLRDLIPPDTEGKFTLTGRIIAWGSMVAALLGLTVPLLLGKPALTILGSYLAIPMLCAPFLFLRTETTSDGAGASSGEGHLSPREHRLFSLILLAFSVLFTLSLLSLVSSPVRQVSYYLLVTGMGLCILLEILLFLPSGHRIPLILAQTGILYLNLVWGVTLKYYFYIGRTDPIGHAWLVDNLLRDGHVTAIFTEYQQFPLWH